MFPQYRRAKHPWNTQVDYVYAALFILRKEKTETSKSSLFSRHYRHYILELLRSNRPNRRVISSGVPMICLVNNSVAISFFLVIGWRRGSAINRSIRLAQWCTQEGSCLSVLSFQNMSRLGKLLLTEFTITYCLNTYFKEKYWEFLLEPKGNLSFELTCPKSAYKLCQHCQRHEEQSTNS